jgi:hypothetical protein
MIFAYSGFVSLVGTTQNVPLELTDAELAQIAQDAQNNPQVQGTTTPTATSTDLGEGIRVATPTIERENETLPPVETPPVPPLRFGL